MENSVEQAIATDLELCDLGIALTKGKLRRQYINHRKECFKALDELSKSDGFDKMSDDELLAELLA